MCHALSSIQGSVGTFLDLESGYSDLSLVLPATIEETWLTFDKGDDAVTIHYPAILESVATIKAGPDCGVWPWMSEELPYRTLGMSRSMKFLEEAGMKVSLYTRSDAGVYGYMEELQDAPMPTPGAEEDNDEAQDSEEDETEDEEYED
ncbi:hypothetical protein NX059_003598 [Plenodomus lindquistii]|nr:hypothetical protein NX059_003598 [Plenodomus lindquistii]